MTAADWLNDRRDWITAPDSVRVVQNQFGTYDVLVRIDGSYVDGRLARRAADMFAAELAGITMSRNSFGATHRYHRDT